MCCPVHSQILVGSRRRRPFALTGGGGVRRGYVLLGKLARPRVCAVELTGAADCQFTPP